MPAPTLAFLHSGPSVVSLGGADQAPKPHWAPPAFPGWTWAQLPAKECRGRGTCVGKGNGGSASIASPFQWGGEHLPCSFSGPPEKPPRKVRWGPQPPHQGGLKGMGCFEMKDAARTSLAWPTEKLPHNWSRFFSGKVWRLQGGPPRQRAQSCAPSCPSSGPSHGSQVPSIPEPAGPHTCLRRPGCPGRCGGTSGSSPPAPGRSDAWRSGLSGSAAAWPAAPCGAAGDASESGCPAGSRDRPNAPGALHGPLPLLWTTPLSLSLSRQL